MSQHVFALFYLHNLNCFPNCVTRWGKNILKKQNWQNRTYEVNVIVFLIRTLFPETRGTMVQDHSTCRVFCRMFCPTNKQILPLRPELSWDLYTHSTLLKIQVQTPWGTFNIYTKDYLQWTKNVFKPFDYQNLQTFRLSHTVMW